MIKRKKNSSLDECSPLKLESSKQKNNNNTNDENDNESSFSDSDSVSSSNSNSDSEKGSFSNSDNETAATTDYETLASKKDHDNEIETEIETDKENNVNVNVVTDDLTAMINAYYPDTAVFHKRKKKIIIKRQAFEVDSSNEQDLIDGEAGSKSKNKQHGGQAADVSMYYVRTELTPDPQDTVINGVKVIDNYGNDTIIYNNNNSRENTNDLDSRINETELQRTLRNVCGTFFNWTIIPFHLIFNLTIPKVNDNVSNIKLSIAFFVSIFWMAILSWLVVDLSTKIGTCLALTPDFMGLTLLAVGSSVPDTFSSILVARQGKMGMAVSNALGSNVFDICICVGLSFMLKSAMLHGNDILVETNLGYQSFIIALFVLLALFVGLMYWSNLVITVKHGWLLLAAYLLFLVVFGFVLEEEE